MALDLDTTHTQPVTTRLPRETIQTTRLRAQSIYLVKSHFPGTTYSMPMERRDTLTTSRSRMLKEFRQKEPVCKIAPYTVIWLGGHQCDKYRCKTTAKFIRLNRPDLLYFLYCQTYTQTKPFHLYFITTSSLLHLYFITTSSLHHLYFITTSSLLHLFFFTSLSSFLTSFELNFPIKC